MDNNGPVCTQERTFARRRRISKSRPLHTFLALASIFCGDKSGWPCEALGALTTAEWRAPPPPRSASFAQAALVPEALAPSPPSEATHDHMTHGSRPPAPVSATTTRRAV